MGTTRSKSHRACKRVVKHLKPLNKKGRIAKAKACSKEKKELEELMKMEPDQLCSQTRRKLGLLIVKKGLAKLKAVGRFRTRGGKNTPTDGSVSSGSGNENKRKGLKRAAKIQTVKAKNEKQTKKDLEGLGAVPSEREIRKNIKAVEWDEHEKSILAEYKIQSAINNDPCLNGLYSRSIEPMIDREIMKSVVNIQFNHLKRESKVVHRSDMVFDDDLMKTIKKSKYVPPNNRILMIGGSSDFWKTNTLVFSDIRRETTDTTSVPVTSMYQYTHRNVFNETKYPKLAKLTKETEKPGNIIKCECCEGGLIKKCWENKDCPCYQANRKLRNILHNKKDKGTKFSTFDPILLRSSDYYFESVGFGCSEACGCRGSCTNNSTYLVDKEIAQFEVFRKNKSLGFGLRTNTLIPAGTPIMEFTGEIIGEDLMESDNDYAFAITDCLLDNFHAEVFEKSKSFHYKKFSEAYLEQMKEQWSQSWYINPKKIGNIARTCCHSCEPNLAVVRVFQKGFSPVNCRLLLVTQQVIFPGEELTFDYGELYVSHNLKSCLCKRPNCKSSNDFDTLSNANVESLEAYEALKYHLKYSEFKKNVLDPVKTRFPSL